MSTEYGYCIADVFTRAPFGGNQLAVLPDARGLSDRRMQDVAKEFGFSETTFVFPPDDPRNTRKVRIFTPASELPFAGHPTVGTASVLATQGHVDVTRTGGTLILEEEVGPISVEVDGAFSRFTTTAPFESPGSGPSPEAVATALSLPEEDIVGCWYGSVGLRFCYVRLKSRESVDRAVLNRAGWSAGIAGGWSPHLYVFAVESRDQDHIYARSFVPALGVEEDPATGSAAAGLAAGLARRRAGVHTALSLRIHQGVRMGRPSVIEATAHIRDGRLQRVSVGGFTTVVARGVLTLPS
ncbi:PhzF family phenazine biosynthesis protein [Microbispora sp. NPDC049125]|uniref:PhzF family phenazine biosynthesis protein n=1 Tax=Microbispora sp. NPDC049125 TaxID=3154929 RepID=UPI003465C4A4